MWWRNYLRVSGDDFKGNLFNQNVLFEQCSRNHLSSKNELLNSLKDSNASLAETNCHLMVDLRNMEDNLKEVKVLIHVKVTIFSLNFIFSYLFKKRICLTLEIRSKKIYRIFNTSPWKGRKRFWGDDAFLREKELIQHYWLFKSKLLKT